MSWSKLIQASAGTGKTYALSGQFISLLLSGEDPSSILASTFTRKAAGEILERIYLRLARAINDTNLRNELSRQTVHSSISSEDLTKALRLLIENQHRLKVSTLDSFSSTIARVFTEELGLPNDWSIQSEIESNAQISSAISAICSSLDSSDIASLVTTLKHGETRRSISKAVSSIVGELLGIYQESDFSAWDWLKVEKPEKEVKSKILALLNDAELPKTQAGEVNKSFIKANQKLIELLQAEKWLDILEQTLLQNAVAGNNFSRISIPEVLNQALTELAVAASKYSLSKLADANRSAYGLLLALTKELQLLEETSGKVSFDRITRRIVELGHSLFSDELYYRLDTKIHHVLLDEFQDTSLLQWKLLEPLIEEKLSFSEETSTFFCVGDGKQAIYSWRGGNTAIFDSIPVRWAHIDIETRELSYRSDPAIIAAVNSIFSSLQINPALQQQQPAISSWLKRYKSHSSYIKTSQSCDQNISFEAIEAEADSEIYAQRLFAQLVEIQQQNPVGNIGILVRRNEDVSYLLDQAQIYQFNLSTEGGTPLIRFPVITSLLALLNLISNPGNSIFEFEVKSSAWAQSKKIEDLLKETKENLHNLGLAQTLQKITWPFSDLYSAMEEKALERLFTLAVSHEISRSNFDLEAFIRLVSASAVEGSKSSKTQVLTIHKSKGLEFDTVVIPNLAWELEPRRVSNYLIERDKKDLKPVKVSLYASKHLRVFSPELTLMAQEKRDSDFEEALSLLYVALTRAKSKLYLFTPSSAISSDTLTAASMVNFAIAAKTCDQISIVKPEVKIIRSIEKPRVSDFQKPLGLIETTHRQRGLGRISPSSLVEFKEDSLSTQANEKFGIIIHKLFSITPWIDETSSVKEQTEALFKIGASKNEGETAISAFNNYLKLDIITSCLKKPENYNPDKTKIFFEKSFIYREQNVLIQGRIDRLVINGSEGLIVDFKVGKTPDLKILDGYKKQLEIYKKAAVNLFPKVKFEAALLFLGDGKRVDI